LIPNADVSRRVVGPSTNGPLGGPETRLPRVEDFAMLSGAVLDGLIEVARHLRGMEEKWALGGDAGEIILGVSGKANELEILTSADGCNEACQRLTKYLVQHPRIQTTRLVRDADIDGEKYPVYTKSLCAELNIGVRLASMEISKSSRRVGLGRPA
jgi:hypothetical protein